MYSPIESDEDIVIKLREEIILYGEVYLISAPDSNSELCVPKEEEVQILCNYIEDYSVIEVESLDEEVEEIQLVQFSSVYPNPAIEYFDVELDEEGHYMLELYDLSGKLIYSKELNSNFIRVNVLSFAKGSYVLNIRDFNTQETNSHKVLVQ